MTKLLSLVALGACSAVLFAGGPSANAAAAPSSYAYAPSPQQGYYPNDAWAMPPSEWQAIEQQGFRDGVRGAYKDAQNHRQPNVNNRDEYRHPNLPRGERQAYREGFQRGYWRGVRHLMGYYTGPNPYPEVQPQQAYYPNESWAVPESDWQAVEQQGFRDGVRGAYKDAQNNRQPNVDNRDEYRDPHVPDVDRHVYREGFRRGYWTGVRHLMGYYNGPNPYAGVQSQQSYYPNESWAVPSSDWQAVEQQGFRDGVRGAYKDAQNHRQPNVNNRDEYRNPDVPRGDRHAYREGFRRGYQVGVQHLMGSYRR